MYTGGTISGPEPDGAVRGVNESVDADCRACCKYKAFAGTAELQSGWKIKPIL
jgi:LRP1 type putative zinc finger protein